MRTQLSKERRWILLGIPVIFGAGSMFHFLYALSGKNIVVAAIAAVNESVWEHEKLILVPMIVWWTSYYIVRGRKTGSSSREWFGGLLFSLELSMAIMPMGFYFYTQAFDVELILVDIFLFLVSVVAGQLAGLHYFRYGKGTPLWLSIGLLVLIVVFAVVVTYIPPKLPLFCDSTDGLYGLK